MSEPGKVSAPAPTPAANQVWKAAARKGFRYIRIDQIRQPENELPYALAHEILPGGEKAAGWLHGIPRDTPMRITLRGKTALSMPPSYELVE